jgi:hypothetical protein
VAALFFASEVAVMLRRARGLLLEARMPQNLGATEPFRRRDHDSGVVHSTAFWRSGWRRLAVALVSLLLRVDLVHASCAPPAPRLVWSYPADGGRDVPTNSRIFFLSTGVNVASTGIQVNGQTVTAEDARPGFGPTLMPRTEYEVVVPATRQDAAASTPINLSFHFTTGDGPGPNAPPATPTVSRVWPTTTRTLSEACQAAVSAMDCFDTGQNTHLVFETAVRPVAFYIVPESSGSIPWTMLWPGDCGDPEVFVDSQSACTGRYRVVAVGPTGATSSAQASCNVSAMPGGCALGSSGTPSQASGLAIFASVLAGSTWLARRRVRR